MSVLQAFLADMVGLVIAGLILLGFAALATVFVWGMFSCLGLLARQPRLQDNGERR